MADETKSVDDFMAGLSNDGTKDPLEENQADPFKATEPEKKETTEDVETVEKNEEVVEKSLPFHKDPKVQRYIEREIAKRIPEQNVQEDSNTEDRTDEVLVRMIGNDTPEKISVIKDFKEILSASQREVQALRQERESEMPDADPTPGQVRA